MAGNRGFEIRSGERLPALLYEKLTLMVGATTGKRSALANNLITEYNMSARYEL
jgi:hypothetical protein